MSNEYKARIDLAAKDSQDFSVVAEVVRDRIVNVTRLPEDAASNCLTSTMLESVGFSWTERHSSRNVLGDRACKFTANSPLLRCAVNPEGPCEGCQHFENA